MRILYIDEAGCTGMLPSATSPIQPVFVIAGVVIHQQNIDGLTKAFLRVKARFYPGLSSSHHYLDRVLGEIKGADLRRQVSDDRRRERRHSIGFLDKVVDLLEQFSVRVVGRVWIKGIGTPFDGRAVYSSSVQSLCACFQSLLASVDDHGLAIIDSRNKTKNAQVAHSIFTQKFSVGGDPYPRLVEMPTYGHSENHVGLQLADLLCSALLFPMATVTYCTAHVTSVHVRPGHAVLTDRYGQRLKRLQYRFLLDGRHRGGITVADAIAHRPGGLLFGGSPIPDPASESSF